MMIRRSLALTLLAAAPAPGQPEGLSSYFGFDAPRTVVVDDGCGPVISADFNGDGLPDLAIVNNSKSRIEVHYLRSRARTGDEPDREYRVNEIPPNPWYDRETLSVGHRVAALRAIDADNDGSLDILYLGTNPAELVVMRQESPDRFVEHARQRVRGLMPAPTALELGDVVGDERIEVVTIADNRVRVVGLDDAGRFGSERPISSDASYTAVFVEDYDGDGSTDILAVAPDDAAPLRLWLQKPDPRSSPDWPEGMLGAELRFEMMGLSEAEPIRFADRPAASIGVIERASQRMVFYDAVGAPVEPVSLAGESMAEREILAEVTGFADGASKDRSIAVTDLDGDGLADLLSTDAKGNAITYYRQSPGIGLLRQDSFPTFKDPNVLCVSQWDEGGVPEVLVLSETEKTVGVSRFDADTGTLGFPDPISLATSGGEPVTMSAYEGERGPALGVIVKLKRDYLLELHTPGGAEPRAIELKSIRRDPESILAADVDRDGTQELLIFTPSEPLVLVRPESGEVLTDADMPQFGLVESAGPGNTAVADIDNDGVQEFLFCTSNFVRACALDERRGWHVLEQVNVDDPGTELISLTIMDVQGRAIVAAADRPGGRALLFTHDDGGRWGVAARLRLLGFPMARLIAGSFAGDAQPSLLCVAEEAMALVRLGGTRIDLEPFAAYRSDSENRLEHEIEPGDVNADGYVDLVVLDAREQMCEIFTFSAARRLHLATEWEVFQSRLFNRGESREFEPSAALVTDLTGDGRDDIALLVHDRVLVLPQMVR